MNLSEQIQEKLKAISELEDLLPDFIKEVDKQVAIESLSEVQERLKELIGEIETISLIIEKGHYFIQKALRSCECDPSPRGDKLDDDDHKVESSSIPHDEPPGDTPAMGMSLSSEEVFYIRYQDHNSTEGCYVSKPDDGDTRFQITVSQSNPLIGILQFYAELDIYEKESVIKINSMLIERDRGPFGSSQGTCEDGEVSLDHGSKHWKLITPIKIKS